MQTLSPHLVCDGAAEAIAFYKVAFGAEEMMRLPGPGGKLVHASLSLNGASVMLVDEMVMPGDAEGRLANTSPRTLGGTPVTIHLMVEDADAAVARAVAAGAKVIVPVQLMFWGDRYGLIEDPFGHRWSIATPGENAPRTTEALTEAMRQGGPAA
jgi:uncharacterized glyoxalase superfamily protein PhnB